MYICIHLYTRVYSFIKVASNAQTLCWSNTCVVHASTGTTCVGPTRLSNTLVVHA